MLKSHLTHLQYSAMVSSEHSDPLSQMQFTNPTYDITTSSAICRYSLEDGHCTYTAVV